MKEILEESNKLEDRFTEVSYAINSTNAGYFDQKANFVKVEEAEDSNEVEELKLPPIVQINTSAQEENKPIEERIAEFLVKWKELDGTSTDHELRKLSMESDDDQWFVENTIDVPKLEGEFL